MKKKGVLGVELGGLIFECGFLYSPGRPGTMYRKNGDPGDPPEEAELELTSCRLEVIEKILGYHLIWADGTEATCSKIPDHLEEGCRVIPLVAQKEQPDLLNSLEDLNALEALYELAEAELERTWPDEDPD